MARHRSHRRRRGTSASATYVLAAFAYVGVLFVVNMWPGWQSVPFLTDQVHSILWLVNLALAASLVANLVYVVDDATRVRALGSYLVALITLALSCRLLEVFPFDFGSDGSEWVAATRLMLELAVLASLIKGARAAVRMVKGGKLSRLAAVLR